MPPRIRLRPQALRTPTCTHFAPSTLPLQQCRSASVAAITPAPPIEQTIHATSPITRHPLNKPPSHKPPEFRKSQLHRQYQSLIKDSPLILLFQHNNLRAVEWMGIRREVAQALKKVDEALIADGRPEQAVGDDIRIQIIQTGIFASALRVVEFFDAAKVAGAETIQSTDPRTASSKQVPNASPMSEDESYAHGLSTAAWKSTHNKKLKEGLDALLAGPIALVTFPNVSPAHLKSILSLLSPNPAFPAPKRRANPGYFEPVVQYGVQKLMLLGARVEGRVFDDAGTRWVGGIEGGLDGLRAQVVHMLQSVSGSLASVLEGAGRSVYFTLEGRKGMLEEESKPKEAESPADAPKDA